MIERVAASMFKTDWPKDDWHRFSEKDHARNRYISMAKSAIEAMREPSHEMMQAGVDERNARMLFTLDDAYHVHRAMIYAALKEE